MASVPRAAPSIDDLLNLVPEWPNRVLAHLREFPHLASARDAHGYSLLHAAASYGHEDLMRQLVLQHHVSPNITDEDNETALFAAESVDIAEVLVETLHADIGWRSNDGLTAEEKIDAEGEFPLVSAYLRSCRVGASGRLGETEQNDRNGARTTTEEASSSNGSSTINHRPPPLPPGVDIRMETVDESSINEAGEPDPEFRRRIEEIACRDDFESEEAQRQLRELVQDAVTDLAATEQGRQVRRRL